MTQHSCASVVTQLCSTRTKEKLVQSPLSSTRKYEKISERGRIAVELHDMSINFLHLQVLADNSLVLQLYTSKMCRTMPWSFCVKSIAKDTKEFQDGHFCFFDSFCVKSIAKDTNEFRIVTSASLISSVGS